MGLELDLTQLAFPFNGVFQPAKRNDTAIQFAPFGDSPLHLKALGVTVCGLALGKDTAKVNKYCRSETANENRGAMKKKSKEIRTKEPTRTFERGNVSLAEDIKHPERRSQESAWGGLPPCMKC